MSSHITPKQNTHRLRPLDTTLTQHHPHCSGHASNSWRWGLADESDERKEHGRSPFLAAGVNPTGGQPQGRSHGVCVAAGQVKSSSRLASSTSHVPFHFHQTRAPERGTMADGADAFDDVQVCGHVLSLATRVLFFKPHTDFRTRCALCPHRSRRAAEPGV